MTDRTCVKCGRPVTGRVLKCRDCVAEYRAVENYREKTLKRDGYVCAVCPSWWNATCDRFYSWRRGPHVQVVKVLLWLLRIRRVRRVEVDHIRRLADNGTHSGANLQVLCLLPGTPVLMADGTERAIEKVTPGDEVVGTDGRPHQVWMTTASQVTSRSVVRVGRTWMTADHEVLTPSGWLQGAFLLPGDSVAVPGSHVLGVRSAEHEVLGPVVRTVRVEVVNPFDGSQRTAELGLHDVPVLHDLPSVREDDADVALAGDRAAAFVDWADTARELVEASEATAVGAGPAEGVRSAGGPVDFDGLAAVRARLDRVRLEKPEPLPEPGALVGAGAVLRGQVPGSGVAGSALGAGLDDTGAADSWETMQEGDFRFASYTGTVHDITVAGSHSFYAGGIGVHNCHRHHRLKTRNEGGRGRRRVDRRLVAAGLAVAAAFAAGAASPPELDWRLAALLILLAVALVYLAVRTWVRKLALDRLWNAELVGLPKVRRTTGLAGSRSGIARSTMHVPTGWGRGLRASRWSWHRLPGKRWIDRLPRYQPDRIVVRHRGWRVPEAQQAEAERIVSAMLGRPFRGEWDQVRDRGVLEPIPPLPEKVDPVYLGDEHRLVIGQGESGRDVVWDVTPGKGTPHCLVVGQTGKGKTTTLRTIADQAIEAGWSVSVADVKRIELRSLKMRVDSYATDVRAILELVSATRSLMELRYVDIESGERTAADLQPVLLIVDEVSVLVETARREWRNPADGGRGHSGEPPLISDLELITQLGRSARVHLALGMQRPDTRWLSGAARDQYGCRIACGPMSADGSRMIFGDGWSGRQVEDVVGRALLQVGSGTPVRLQVALVPDVLPGGESELPVTAADV